MSLTQQPPPIIALVSESDPTALASWSGIPRQVLDALRRAGAEVHPIGPLNRGSDQAGRRLMPRLRRLFGNRGRELPAYEPASLRALSLSVTAALARLPRRPDWVLAIHADPLAELATDLPCAFVGDATFEALVDYYPGFDNLTRRARRNGRRMWRRGLARCAFAALASEWACASARRDHPDLASRVHVSPFGATLPDAPTRTWVEQAVNTRESTELRLLSVGVDWERKGMADCVALLSKLHSSGIPARLDLVGCLPPEGTVLPAGVHLHGRLDKASPEEGARLTKLYRSSHYLLLASRAECFGIVVAEAAAHGVPTLAVDTGGVPSAVLHGETGFCWPRETFLTEAARVIAEFGIDSELYRRQAAAARARYESTLNWDAFAARLLDLMARHAP